MARLLIFIIFMPVLGLTIKYLGLTQNKFRWRDGILEEKPAEPVNASTVYDLKNCTMCPRAFKPICASNGRWYYNPCFMACAVGDNSSINILYEGVCRPEHLSMPPPPEEKTVEENEYKVTTSTISEAECMSKCPKTHDPVCGSDNISYDNICLLRCIEEGRVRILHQGKCLGLFPIVSGSDVWNCTMCSKIYDPVCATNEEWYYNPCVMNCTLGADTDVKVNYPGKCINFI